MKADGQAAAAARAQAGAALTGPSRPGRAASELSREAHEGGVAEKEGGNFRFPFGCCHMRGRARSPLCPLNLYGAFALNSLLPLSEG